MPNVKSQLKKIPLLSSPDKGLTIELWGEGNNNYQYPKEIKHSKNSGWKQPKAPCQKEIYGKAQKNLAQLELGKASCSGKISWLPKARSSSH